MPTDVLLFIGLLLSISIVLSPLSSRIGMPILLLFLAIDMLAGEDGIGGLRFDDFEAAFLAGNLALAIILLDGGMRTRASSFRVGLRPAAMLATVGVALTAAVTGLAAMWLFDLPLLVGLLIGTIVSSTDAAAVFALLQGRGLHLNDRVSATLEIESGSNDPMAIFLTLVLLSLLTETGDGAAVESLYLLLQQFGLGALGGWLGGRGLAALLNRIPLVPAFYPLLVAAGGLVIFGGVNTLGGSGFLAIYLAGVVLGNRRVRMMPAILQMHDGLAWLAQMLLFLILGLLVAPSQLVEVAVPGLAIAAVLILIARPLAVLLTLVPFDFHWNEKAFISWVGLRGAVPIVLALFPVMAGVEHAHLLFNVAFFVVLVSLLVQGSTVAPVARWLGLEVPPNTSYQQRFELDIPGQYDYEFIGYRLVEGSPVIGRDPMDIAMPGDARIIAALRDGRPMDPDDDQLCVGDYVYALATAAELPELDRLFGPARPEEGAFYGEFVVNGDVALADVAAVYGLQADDAAAGETLHDYLSRHFQGRQVVGDAVTIGQIRLVIREMNADRIVSVGLKL